MYASIIPCKRDNYSNSLDDRDDRDTFYSFKNQMKTPCDSTNNKHSSLPREQWQDDMGKLEAGRGISCILQFAADNGDVLLESRQRLFDKDL